MEGKKKYFALIIFLFLGLMIFTFANPAEEEKEFKGGDKDQSETVTNKREDTTEEDTNDTEQEQQDQNQQQNIVTNNNQGNAQGNQGNDAGQTEEDPVDTTLRDALAAVEKAEGTYSQEDVDAAKELLNNVTDTTEKGNLEERLEEVEAGIAVLALLENLEVQVKEADKKADMTDATSYRDTNEIANKIESLNNETVKEELSKRLGEVSKLLDDNAAPTTKVEAKVYGDNVEITAEDEAGNPFQVFLTKDEENEEEISSGYKTASDGVYTLRLVDNAFNEQTIKFTVDTTEPALKDLTNGAHYKEITLNTEDKTKVTIQVTNKDKNEVTSVEEGAKLTEDATYEVLLTDEAGNTATYWLAIDTTRPTISGVTNNSIVNKSENAYIRDKFLTLVKVSATYADGTTENLEFTRADFTVGANNENYEYKYRATKAGTYIIYAEDKIGNSYSETFTIDRTAPKAKVVGVYSVATANHKYLKNGEKIRVVVEFDEEVKLSDTFVANFNGKKKAFIRSDNTSKYEYIAQTTLPMTETKMVEGKVSVTITGATDLAGNTAEPITELNHSKYNELTYDRTPATITLKKRPNGNALNKVPAHYNFSIYAYIDDANEYKATLKYGDKSKDYTSGTEIGSRNNYTLEVVDAAGNITIVDFAVDKDAPSINGVKNGAYYNTTVTPTIADKKDNLATVTLNGNDYTSGTPITEEGEYTLVAKDYAGNTKTVKFTIDTTAPVLTYKLSSDELNKNRTNEDVTVTITSNEELKAVENWTLSEDKKVLTKVYGANTTETLKVYDLAGNESSITYTVKDISKTIPEQKSITYSVTEMTNGTVTVTIDATKPILVPTGWERGNRAYRITKVFTANAVEEVQLKDLYGNVGKTTVTVNNIDKEPPIISFNGKVTGDNKDTFYLEKGANTGVVKITAKVTDNADGESTLSPYKLDFEHAHEHTDLDEVNARLDSSREGKYTYYYKVTDRAGNTTEKKLYVIVQDTRDLEVVSYTVNYDDKTGTAVAVIVTNKDLNTITAQGWGQSLSKLNVITKKFYYNTDNNGEAVKVKDLSGNEITYKAVVRKINEIKHRNEIKLLEDETLSDEIVIAAGTTKTIDLNNHKLIVKNTNADHSRMIKNYGKLIIKNGTLVNENYDSYGLVDNYATGELVIENVKVKDNGSYDGSSIKNRGGNVTVTNSEFTIVSSKGYGLITGADYGNDDEIKYGNTAVYNEGTLTIKNTKITSDSERAYALNLISGTATVEDVNAKGNHGGLAVTGGTAVIKNMSYESDVHYGIYVANNSTEGTNITINGGKFIGQLEGMLLYNSGDKGDIQVTINGGEFISKTGKPALKVDKGTTTHAMNVTIKGGTFKDTDVTEYIDETVYRQDTTDWAVKEISKIDNVSYLKEIATVGGTYTLDSDLTLENEIIKVAKNINLTINTNGKKISGTSDKASTAKLFEVASGGSLTLTGNGTITFRAYAPDTNWDPEGFPTYATNTIANSGTLVIDGPTIINTTPRGGASYAIDNYAGGNLTVLSGTIKQTGGDVAIRMNTATAGEAKANNVTIKGGTISGRRAIWIHLAGGSNAVAPYVNLTVDGGTLETTDTNGNNLAIYSYSYGNSFENVKATFNGGTVNGTTAFGATGDYAKTGAEAIVLNGTTFNGNVGIYNEADEWVSLK